MIDLLGAPPTDTAKQADWIANLLIQVAWLQVNGRIGTELAASLRATAAAMDRAVAPKLQAELDRLLADESTAIATTETGPALERLDP